MTEEEKDIARDASRELKRSDAPLDDMAARIACIERICGHTFSDTTTIEAAITHPSAIEDGDASLSYERLEFLGDSILGAIVAEEVFIRFPDFDEGMLTRLKVSLVSGETLTCVSRELGIDKVVLFGPSEEHTNMRGLKHALENVYESVVAALTLDGGIDCARTFVLSSLSPHMDADHAQKPENPKSVLQELLQVDHRHPSYRLVGTAGPSHDCVFTSEVSVEGVPLGQGSGRSKKAAEAQAAQIALDHLEQEGHDA